MTGWRRPSLCGGNGECIQVTETAEGGLALKNSSLRHGGLIYASRAEFAAFVQACRAGEFDDLTREATTMTRSMIDSAYPMKAQPTPLADIVLIYAGGDTPHPWTTAEMLAMPNRYLWPCWVRSNPQQVNVVTDVDAFLTWLHAHAVPKGTCVILDLETAIDVGYVNAFNKGLAAAEYKVTKYGSRDFIFQNPKTDGGTYVAWPGHPADFTGTIGDTVAVQYAFDGTFDKSVAKDQAELPLWDTKPHHDVHEVHCAAGVWTRLPHSLTEVRPHTHDVVLDVRHTL